MSQHSYCHWTMSTVQIEQTSSSQKCWHLLNIKLQISPCPTCFILFCFAWLLPRASPDCSSPPEAAASFFLCSFSVHHTPFAFLPSTQSSYLTYLRVMLRLHYQNKQTDETKKQISFSVLSVGA